MSYLLDGVLRNFSHMEDSRFYLTREGRLAGPMSYLMPGDTFVGPFRPPTRWPPFFIARNFRTTHDWLPNGDAFIYDDDSDKADDLVWLVPDTNGFEPVDYRVPAVGETVIDAETGLAWEYKDKPLNYALFGGWRVILKAKKNEVIHDTISDRWGVI